MLGGGISTISGNENQPGLHEDETECCSKPRHSLKGPKHRLTCSQTLALSSSEGTVAQKHQGIYRKRLQGEGWLQREGLSSHHSFSQLAPTLAQTATNCRSLLAPTRWPWARHRQKLMLACTGAPAYKVPGLYTWQLVSDYTAGPHN